MGSSPFQINGRPATESDYKFFYDKLKEAGLQPEALAGDQSFDAGEIRGILDINHDQQLTGGDFQGMSASVYNDLSGILAKFDFALPAREEVGIHVYGVSRLEDGICCYGNENRFRPTPELAAEAAAQTIQPESSATPPATPKKKSKGAEAVKKPSSETHDLEPSGDLALRLRAAADEEARRRGGGMAHYEGFELTTSISVENLTVTVDPIAGTGTVTMNGETKTFALGKGEGSVAVDLKTGKISHSVGVNVGGNSIVLDRDGFSFSAEGVGMKMGYDLSVQSTTFKPTVSVGPFQIQGDKGRLDVGASLKLEGGPVSVEAKAVAHYSVDGEKVDVVVQDTIDAAVKKVNGKGLFEPLRQIFP